MGNAEATSNDMRLWKRYPGNPVFTHESQGIITGDAQIQKMYIKDGVVLDNPSYDERQGAQRLYTMFYFSAFNPTREYKAYNTFACSKDLVHWYDWEGPDLIKPSEEFDSFFAHKSFVVKRQSAPAARHRRSHQRRHGRVGGSFPRATGQEEIKPVQLATL